MGKPIPTVELEDAGGNTVVVNEDETDEAHVYWLAQSFAIGGPSPMEP